MAGAPMDWCCSTKAQTYCTLRQPALAPMHLIQGQAGSHKKLCCRGVYAPGSMLWHGQHSGAPVGEVQVPIPSAHCAFLQPQQHCIATRLLQPLLSCRCAGRRETFGSPTQAVHNWQRQHLSLRCTGRVLI